MSRLCVKGIPRKFEEKDLRELFSFAGEVTDAKVIRNRDGQSRQFAFVGFRNDTDAAQAQKRINGTYVRSSRVQVELARPTGDPNLPRPWSRHSKGSSAYTKRVDREEREQAVRFREETRAHAKQISVLKEAERKAKSTLPTSKIAEKDREAFDAFKDAIQKRGRAPVWADGDASINQKEEKKAHRKETEQEKGVADSGSDSDDDSEEGDNKDEEYQDLPSAVKESKKTEDSSEAKIIANPVALNESISDADYFKSKISKDVDIESGSDSSDEDESDSSDDEENDDGASGSDASNDEADSKDDATRSETATELENPGPESVGKDDKEPENLTNSVNVRDKYASKNENKVDAAETGRLFVRNLSYSVNEEDLERLFEKFGTLADVHMVVDSVTKRSRGVALVLFVIPENAAKAMAALDGTIFCGRLLHILPGRPRPTTLRNPSNFASTGAGMNTFKREQEEARAQAARSGADAHAQNTMFLGSDAVADTVASRLGVSKAELYGAQRGESGAAAVRLAVAEASIQAETREFLLVNGVDLKKAEAASTAMAGNTKSAKQNRLSRTAFLVKNLPASTKESQLDDMFAKFGTLNRLALAPSGLMAVVEYATPGEAKRAYNGLAYKRFRDVPLYLEWLPVEAISNSSSTAKADVKSRAAENGTGKDIRGTDENVANSNSVYVKNLNFDTKEEALKSHFKTILRKRQDILKGLRAVSIATKKSDKDGVESRLSMGFGFAEFASYALAAEAVKIMQGSNLDGHTLELRLSNRVVDTGGAVKKRQRNEGGKQKPNAKIIVRNIAFEANAREIRELFSSFGQIKSVRLPRKMDGSHRGFGFLEFVSTTEAKSAKEALSDAHLYGRHLVIEYADEEADGAPSIEKLMQDAARQSSKRRRVGGAIEEEDADDEEERLRDEMYQ